MEKANDSRPSHSLVRRLAAPLGLAAAVLGGGGWGVYQVTSSPLANTAGQPSATAHSASPAKEELKNLFATDSKTNAETESPQPPKIDRYKLNSRSTPMAPEADRYTLASAKSTNPFATIPATPTGIPAPPTGIPAPPTGIPAPPTGIPAPPIGVEKETVLPQQAKQTSESQDRYGDYTAASPPPLPPLAPTPAAIENVAATPTDITRGQEPSLNPLRTSTATPRQQRDAQAAFAAEPSAPAPAQAKSKMAGALGSAQPLQPSLPESNENNRSAGTNGRYPLGSPQLANSSTTLFDKSDARLAPQPPAPSIAQQSPKQSLQQPTAPPVNLGGPSNITPTPGLVNNPGTGRPGERLLEGMQNPSVTIQKLSPEEIQVGRRCTFAIRVQNTGQRTAQDVRIHDEIPLGTELVGTAPRASISGSQVVWELGMLSVGEERTVEMELIPTDEGELGSVATVLVAAQASAKSRCTRPELALRLSSSKPQVLLGQQQLVQIEVSNPGSGDATGVMLLESVPAGVSHEAGPALEFEIGTLRAGESRRLELVLSAEKAGKIQNTMTARADASLQVEASCEFEVIAPELQLSIEGPQKRYLERPATYQVSVDNPGTATAHEVELVTHLPKGLQFVSANNMGEYDSASHTVQWSLAELPANERGTVELVALPIEAGAQILQVATKAQQGLEDRTEKQVLVEGLAALMFEVADLADPIEIGGETTYEIRVVNQGSKAAGNVQVVAILPPGLRALSGQGETRHTIQGERVIFAPLPSLGPKADTTFRIQVQGTRPGDQRLRVQLTTDEVQQPITKEESTHVYSDE